MLGLSATVGFAIVSAVMLDFLLTTVSLRSGGFVATRVAHAVRGLSETVPVATRSFAGTLAMTSVALTWVTGLWIGWTFVFADALDGFEGPEGSVLTVWDAAGFTGATLSTLGIGVLTPELAWLHILVVVASVTGMIVLTLSVTYVLNVSQVANESRSLARWIDDLTGAVDGLDDADAASLFLSTDGQLLYAARQLTERRQSFPLATIYEWRGSNRDVIRAAIAGVATLQRLRGAGSDPAANRRLEVLHAGLADLSTS